MGDNHHGAGSAAGADQMVRESASLVRESLLAPTSPGSVVIPVMLSGKLIEESALGMKLR